MRVDQQLLQANALLGRTVEIKVDENTVTSGMVTAVQIKAGTPYVVVNGESFDVSQLLSITPTVSANEPQPEQTYAPIPQLRR